MPVYINQVDMRFKDEDGNYKQADVISVDGDLTEAVAAAIEEIETKGEETIESIPDDYTTLSESVDDLKSAYISGQRDDYLTTKTGDVIVSLSSLVNMEQGIINNAGVNATGTGWRTVGYYTFEDTDLFVRGNNIPDSTYSFRIFKYNRSDHSFVSKQIITTFNDTSITIDPDYDYRFFIMKGDQSVLPDLDDFFFVYKFPEPLEILGLDKTTILDKLTPVATIIDDSFGTQTALDNIAGIVEHNSAVRMTLAIPCSAIDTTDGLGETLRQLQCNGHQLANHTYNYDGDAWNSSSAEYDPSSCEEELVDGQVFLNLSGFLNTDYVVYPGGHTSDELIRRQKQWVKAGVLAGSGNGINHLADNDRWHLSRCFIRAYSGETVAQAETRIKGYIDTAFANKDWIIFGTHSQNTSEFNASLVNAITDYVTSKGMEFETLHDAFSSREWLFKLSEIFTSIGG